MRMRLSLQIGWLVAGTLAAGPLFSQSIPESSGGPLLTEQAAYDVHYYDLVLRIYPADSAIAGTLTMQARVVHPLEHLVLQLDTVLAVDGIALLEPSADGEREVEVSFERRTGEVWIDLHRTRQPGEDLGVKISYSGKPRSGPEGSFGQFIWGATPDGQPWITVNCEIRERISGGR